MKPGDKGDDVLELQEQLLEEGYELPKYGPDGHFGEETLEALNLYEAGAGLTITLQTVGQATLDAIGWDPPEDDEALEPPPRNLTDVKCYDLRWEKWEDRNPKKFKRYKGQPVSRGPAHVTGITIHQTACNFGVADYQVKAAGGDKNLALARRSLRVACHVMAFKKGFIAWPNPLDWYVYHGNGFNAFELGVEIEGNYPGIKGNKTWNGKVPTRLTDDTVHAARAAIELLVVEGRKAGMPIEFIHAHRQSSATRRDDPGEDIWKRVVLDYCIPILGLRTEPYRTLKGRTGDGRPIPVKWDPNGTGSY